MQCIFCSIVKGEIDSAKVFEDEDVMAFLDVNPLTKGHCLVIPKQHFENVFDISEDALQNIVVVAKNLSGKIKDVLRANGIRLSQSNGKTAGQEVMHFHLHVIPCYEGDMADMNSIASGPRPLSDFNGLKQIAERIKL